MKININESGISFNRDGGSNAVLNESVLKEIEERLKNINDKVEYSDKIPTDEDIVIWINPEEDPAQEYLIRINDETVASNTVWSSEKVYQQINNMFIQADSHIHFNKDVLDKITAKDIANWNSKSNFDGSYKSLIDKPAIPSIEGLASEEYVNEAIENLQLPPNLATKEDIPTNVSELENDSGFITKTELEDKNYLVYDDVTHFALKEEVPTKISELEDDKNIATLNDLHGHNNKTVIDGITSEQVAKWDSNTSFDGDYYSLKNRPNIPTHTSNLQNDSGFITDTELDSKGYLTEHQDLSEYAKTKDIPTKVSELENDSGFITEEDIDYVERVVSSDTQPTDENVILWVNTSEDSEVTPIAKIDDGVTSLDTTWSSEKIFQYIEDLIEKYNDLLIKYNKLSEEVFGSEVVDNNYLQDINGNYLQDINGNYLLPSDDSSSSTDNNYLQDINGDFLQDIEGNYLILKESV